MEGTKWKNLTGTARWSDGTEMVTLDYSHLNSVLWGVCKGFQARLGRRSGSPGEAVGLDSRGAHWSGHFFGGSIQFLTSRPLLDSRTGTSGCITTTSSSSAPQAARRPAHRAASHAQRPLWLDPQLPGAATRWLQEVQEPEVHGPLHQESLVAAPPRRPALSRIAERTWKAPLPGPGKSLLRYRGKASARPNGPHSAAAASAPDRRGFFAVGRCGYVPPRSKASQAGRPLPYLETPILAR